MIVTDATEYALCWEDPPGDEAWVIRTRREPDYPEWDVWLVHPDLGEGDVAAAKRWAAEKIAAEGREVIGWQRDGLQDFVPEFADPEPELPHYTAWIATASDVVLGDHCDVIVLEDEVNTTWLDEDGQEHPVYTSSAKDPLELGEIPVRVDDPDRDEKAQQEAAQRLSEHGWRVVEKWDYTDNAMSATVERG